MACGLFWFSAFGLGAFLGTFPPWWGWVMVAMAALAWWMGPGRSALALLVLAAAPALTGAGGLWAPLVPLGLAAGAVRWSRLRRERLWVAGLILVIAAVVIAKQVVAAKALGAALDTVFALGCSATAMALLVVATPSTRTFSALFGGLGVGALLVGLLAPPVLETLPVEQALRMTAQHRLVRAWPAVERRVLERLEAGDVPLAAEAVALAPSRVAIGEALVLVAPDLAMQKGWSPSEVVRPESAIALARALDRAGLTGRAVSLLRRQERVGEVARWLAIFAYDIGQEGLARHASQRVSSVVRADASPVILEGRSYPVGGVDELLFEVTERRDQLDVSAHGRSWRGVGPRLILRLAGRVLIDDEVPEEGLERSVSIDLEPGFYRIFLEYPNDDSGADGDRNLGPVDLVLR